MGKESERFGIPRIVSELSGKTVLTSQFLRGAGLSKYEAVIPNVFTCAGKLLKVKSIVVTSSSGCAYHTAMRDGIWYLQVDKSCADANPSSIISLRICWNDCD